MFDKAEAGARMRRNRWPKKIEGMEIDENLSVSVVFVDGEVMIKPSSLLTDEEVYDEAHDTQHPRDWFLEREFESIPHDVWTEDLKMPPPIQRAGCDWYTMLNSWRLLETWKFCREWKAQGHSVYDIE